MTRNDIANEVAKKTGLTPEQSRKAFEATINAISQSLREGNDVFIRGFGTFRVNLRKAKKARDISRGVFINVPPMYEPKFKPAPRLKRSVHECNISQPDY